MTTNYDAILVPTDGSESCERAVDHAVGLASCFEATIHALYVVDTDAVDISLGTEQVQRLKEGRFGEMKELKRAAEEATGYVASRAKAAGVDIVEVHTAGTPYKKILKYVDEHGIDLVAMTRHRRSGVQKLLIGSTTKSVLKRAVVPVLIVND